MIYQSIIRYMFSLLLYTSTPMGQLAWELLQFNDLWPIQMTYRSWHKASTRKVQLCFWLDMQFISHTPKKPSMLSDRLIACWSNWFQDLRYTSKMIRIASNYLESLPCFHNSCTIWGNPNSYKPSMHHQMKVNTTTSQPWGRTSPIHWSWSNHQC